MCATTSIISGIHLGVNHGLSDVGWSSIGRG